MKKIKLTSALLFAVVFSLSLCGCNKEKGLSNSNQMPSGKTVFVMDTIASIMFEEEYISPVEDILTELSTELSMFSDGAIATLNSKGSNELNSNIFMLLLSFAAVSDDYPLIDITCGELTSLWKVSLESGAIPSDEDIQSALSTCGIDKLSFDIPNKVCTLSDGAKLDLGCVAKGFALDLCKEELISLSAQSGICTLGSSTLLFGKKSDDKDFTIGVRDPRGDEESVALTFEAGDCFISTSGGYERSVTVDGVEYDHILNLETGMPIETDLLSVTVICDNGMMSDLIATHIYSGGKRELLKYLFLSDITVIAITDENTVYTSEGFEDSIQIKNSKYKLA